MNPLDEPADDFVDRAVAPSRDNHVAVLRRGIPGQLFRMAGTIGFTQGDIAAQPSNRRQSCLEQPAPPLPGGRIEDDEKPARLVRKLLGGCGGLSHGAAYEESGLSSNNLRVSRGPLETGRTDVHQVEPDDATAGLDPLPSDALAADAAVEQILLVQDGRAEGAATAAAPTARGGESEDEEGNREGLDG